MSVNYVSISDYLKLSRASDTSEIVLLSEDFEDEARGPKITNSIAARWARKPASILSIAKSICHHGLAHLGPFKGV